MYFLFPCIAFLIKQVLFLFATCFSDLRLCISACSPSYVTVLFLQAISLWTFCKCKTVFCKTSVVVVVVAAVIFYLSSHSEVLFSLILPGSGSPYCTINCVAVYFSFTLYCLIVVQSHLNEEINTQVLIFQISKLWSFAYLFVLIILLPLLIFHRLLEWRLGD